MTDSRTKDESDELRRYFVVMPVVVQDEPNACRIEFKVGNQMFRFGPDYCEDWAQAEWYVSMACHALRNLISEVRS